jgi:hypothetical protein
MKVFWEKLKRSVRSFFIGLFIGMKNAEDETLHQSGLDGEAGTSINQHVSENRVSQALLRGEVTQEVEDLRYRTYAVARESSKFNYFSPTLAKRKKPCNPSSLHIENSEGREIVTVQENKLEVETVSESLLRIGSDGKYVRRQNEYNIEVRRPYGVTPRFRFEDFMKKVVVFKGDDVYTALLDIYVSKYPDDKNIVSKPFVREVEKVLKQGVRTDMMDFSSLSFETYKAYGMDDMVRFEFGDPQLLSVMEFDGDYILRLQCNVIDGGTDMTREFYSERMAKKYENNERKELTYEMDPNEQVRTYTCAECGKTVYYDARALDQLNASDEATDGAATEFLDYEMAEQTFGRMLCRDCIRKERERLYRSVAEHD